MKEHTSKKVAILPVGSAKKLILPGKDQDWRVGFWLGCLDACDPEGKEALFELYKTRHYIDISTIGASAGTASGAVGIVGGVGCMVAGAVFTSIYSKYNTHNSAPQVYSLSYEEMLLSEETENV